MKFAFGPGRLAVLPLLLALSLSACGGSDDVDGAAPQTAAPPSASASAPPTTPAPATGSAAPSTAPSGAPPSAMRTLTDCLRRHGVEVPATGQKWTPPPGYDPAKAQKALKECLRTQAKGG
ncbi:hypothetical protein [Actinomadura fibrosa]|uniref:Uncharacterized protein n=1 Tax=Actinomadura fibrosa TaxID=111802 RepID=A0ABW2XNK5_9ACTN|nr:hypothetical protein [Actinomadura fibrosa]